MVDCQILYSIKKYEPIAFNDVPYGWAKPMMMLIGILSLLMNIVCYIFCIVVFGGLSNTTNTRQILFSCFVIKSILWSPFAGMEYYDTFFEQIYHDVRFQLNVIRPDEETRSPNLRK